MADLKKCLFFFPFLLVYLILAGCNTSSVRRLVWEEYPEKPTFAMVELYVGKIERASKPIAIMNSKFYTDQTRESKAEMLAELRRMAGRMGADAVVNIRLLPKKFEGMVMDDKVPFPAWKPGDYSAYFMRGTAIVFEEKKEGKNASSP